MLRQKVAARGGAAGRGQVAVVVRKRLVRNEVRQQMGEAGAAGVLREEVESSRVLHPCRAFLSGSCV